MSSQKPPEKITLTKKEFAKRNRRAFIYAGFSVVCGFLGVRWILNSKPEDETPGALRAMYKANEAIWKKLSSNGRINSSGARPVDGTEVRINGDIGIDTEMNLSEWVLEYESPTLKKKFTLDDLKKLPRSASHSEFRCIEGWSQPISFEGIKFSDFLKAVDPEGVKMPYVGLETPYGEYYVSLDMESMLHPQTTLADMMNGAPLGPDHGEPLRLIIPIKYGIKNLKCIGKIFLAENRPPDYWAENGYDWYAGL